MILAFGIMAWVISMACGPLSCPFGFMAWWMGSQDLRAMEQGRMDPSGRGMTQAGQILGMIYSVLCILGLLFLLFMFLIMFANDM